MKRLIIALLAFAPMFSVAQDNVRNFFMAKPISAAPSPLLNGMFWYDATAGKFKVYEGGVVKDWISSGGGTSLPIADNLTLFRNNADATKTLRFDLSGISTATLRTYTFPDYNGTIALVSDIPTGVITQGYNTLSSYPDLFIDAATATQGTFAVGQNNVLGNFYLRAQKIWNSGFAASNSTIQNDGPNGLIFDNDQDGYMSRLYVGYDQLNGGGNGGSFNSGVFAYARSTGGAIGASNFLFGAAWTSPFVSKNGFRAMNLTTNGYLKTTSSNGTFAVSTSIPNTDITGLGSLATLSSVNNVNWSGAQLTVGNGGTGTTTLTGVLIGNGTSAFTAIAGTGGQLLRRNVGNTAYEFFTPTYLTSYTETDPLALKITNNLSDLGSAATARTNLGLGSLAVASTINNANWSGTQLAIANGGTGATTQQAAINALAGAVTSGQYLRGNGTNVLMSGIQVADVPTLNQNTTGTAANITATTNSTLTTLSSLSLPGTQVTGNISGNAANVTGVVAIANGGTGQATANAAMNALLPSKTGNALKVLRVNAGETDYELATASGGGSTGTTFQLGNGSGGFTASELVQPAVGDLQLGTSSLTTSAALRTITTEGTQSSIGLALAPKAGNVLIGLSSDTYGARRLQTFGNVQNIRYGNTATAALHQFIKYRGTVSSAAALSSGDAIGSISFNGSDNTTGTTVESARIDAVVNGTVAVGSVPTDLVFYTGTTSATENARINSSGDVIVQKGLSLVNNTSPSTPAANQVEVFASQLANRTITTVIDPNGIRQSLESKLSRNALALWLPPGNATTVPGVLGLVAPTVVGTATARNIASTSRATRTKRLGYVSAATAGALAEARVASAQFSAGSGTQDGSGFYYSTRFVPSNAASVTGERFFIGVMNSTAAATNVEPNTLTNCIGIAQLSTDATQFYVVYGGSAAQTNIAVGTGIGNPSALSTDLYELTIYAPPTVANTFYLRLENVSTGQVYNTTLSGAATVVPQSTTLLAHRAWKTNNATALAVGFDIASVYIESF